MRHYHYLERYDNPIEKAREMHRILKAEGLSQNNLAKKLGISRVRITQLLNPLRLSPEQQKYIIENGREQQITERALRKNRLSR